MPPAAAGRFDALSARAAGRSDGGTVLQAPRGGGDGVLPPGPARPADGPACAPAGRQDGRRRTGRSAAQAAPLLVGVVFVVSTAGCGTSAADGRAAAAAARPPVVAAARELNQRLVAAQATGPDQGSGVYVRCGTASPRLHYSVSLDLFPFHRGEAYAPFSRRVVTVVTADGWTLRRLPLLSGLDAKDLLYKITKPVGRLVLVGQLGLLNDSLPRSSIVVNGACFDAGPAADGLVRRFDRSPLATR